MAQQHHQRPPGEPGTGEAVPAPTVRDATLDVLRAYGLTTIFSNPGSTEVAFLSDLPADLDFVLALHEGSVVGMATGWAVAKDRPALVLLHTTAGLGNAVSALATARVNRAPLVVIVGQQDRRHLAFEPFLTGELAGLAGEYPVWTTQPARAQDVPGAVARAAHEAATGKGPAVVIVPMDDWSASADDPANRAAAHRVLRGRDADPTAVAEVGEFLRTAQHPALVVGAGADSAPAWEALVRLAERLRCPVYQESFGARAGFPQDHPRFAGFLPADRPRLREVLDPHDAVLCVGAPAFRQYPFTEGLLAPRHTRIAVVSEDHAEVHRSPAEIGVHAAIPSFVRALTDSALTDSARTSGTGTPHTNTAHTTTASTDTAHTHAVVAPPNRDLPPPRRVDPPAPPAPGEPLRAAHVLHALAERAAVDTVFVEETPSSRPDMHRLLPARRPLGFLSAAMGGLGFALPAAVGVRMATSASNASPANPPSPASGVSPVSGAGAARPVIAVVGDGSALYQVQALWSAARYQVGVLFIVLANGRYAVMDRLADAHGGKPPWPAFQEVSVSGLARALGCPTREITDHDTLIATLDDVIPTLTDRTQPLLLDIAVTPDPTFLP